MRKPVISNNAVGRIVARTFSLEEASRLAKTYELQGQQTEILENKQGQMVIYEVWVKENRDGLFARVLKTD